MRSTTSSNRRRTTGKPPAKHPNAHTQSAAATPAHDATLQSTTLHDTPRPPTTHSAEVRQHPTSQSFSANAKELITLHVTRASETNEKLGPTVQCRLTSTEYREFKKLARSIGHSQLLRILITQAIAKAKNGGLQIDLTVHRATPYAENQETTRGNHDIQLSEAIA